MEKSLVRKEFTTAFMAGDVEKIKQLIGEGLLKENLYNDLESLLWEWTLNAREARCWAKWSISEDSLIQIMTLLLDNGFDIDDPNPSDIDRPNLLWTIFRQYVQSRRLIELLIDRGAELNAYDEYCSVLDAQRSYIELDARIGYPDLSRTINDACRIAIYHGALPLEIIKMRQRGKRKRYAREYHKIINAVLDLDYDFFAGKDASYLKRWACLEKVVEFAQFANPKETCSPSNEYQARIFRIVRHILEVVGHEQMSEWFMFECCSQQLEYLIISLLELNDTAITKKVRGGVSTYGCLIEEHRKRKVDMTFQLFDLAGNALQNLDGDACTCLSIS
jgi:hypothetical protein